MPTRARSSSASSADSSASEQKPVKPNGVKLAAGVNGNGGKDGDAAKAEEPEDPCDPGMKTGVKDLYSGKEDKKGRYQWQETIPEDLGVAVENDKTAKCECSQMLIAETEVLAGN